MTKRMEVSPVAQTLMRARERIEREGWARHTFKSVDGGYCMMGAVGWHDEVVDRRAGVWHAGGMWQTPEGDQAILLLSAALARKGRRPQVYLFNDDPGTTREQVLEIFDEAIAEAMGVRVT